MKYQPYGLEVAPNLDYVVRVRVIGEPGAITDRAAVYRGVIGRWVEVPSANAVDGELSDLLDAYVERMRDDA